MSRPMVVIACMTWLLRIVGPYRHPLPWHSRAGGGAVHSIDSGPPICALMSTRLLERDDESKISHHAPVALARAGCAAANFGITSTANNSSDASALSAPYQGG